MTFAEISESAFLSGPKCFRKVATLFKWSILLLLFVTYFGSCSVYAVIIAKNFQQVLEHWMDKCYNIRLLIVSLLVPFILLTWIPNLKSLAPVSLVANLFMACGLAITIYYLSMDLPSIKDRDYAHLSSLPAFFAITIFAMESIGVIMPLENSMRTPTHFLGWFGVMTQGMIGVTFVNILLGFMGYLRYGPDTEETITLNLPVKELPAQLVKVLITLGIYCTFALQFTVCLEIIWDGIKDKCSKRPLLANYVVRTFLVVSAVGIAIAVPTIAPFMGLIGAFCFSSLGLIMPAVIEMMLDLETGYGRCYWKLWKNVLIIGFGIFALVLGSKNAIEDIIELYE